jgi:hypothetical protein
MFVASGAGDKWRLLPRSTDGNKSANMMSSSGSRETFRWREKDSKPRSPGRVEHFSRPPRDAATTNRPGSQNRVLTIAKGRFTVRRASLSSAMISRPGQEGANAEPCQPGRQSALALGCRILQVVDMCDIAVVRRTLPAAKRRLRPKGYTIRLRRSGPGGSCAMESTVNMHVPQGGTVLRLVLTEQSSS